MDDVLIAMPTDVYTKACVTAAARKQAMCMSSALRPGGKRSGTRLVTAKMSGVSAAQVNHPEPCAIITRQRTGERPSIDWKRYVSTVPRMAGTLQSARSNAAERREARGRGSVVGAAFMEACAGSCGSKLNQLQWPGSGLE